MVDEAAVLTRDEDTRKVYMLRINNEIDIERNVVLGVKKFFC